ncbi:S-methyl-5-thioribose-1-phosphate isomerase [candidate division KSB1 bacterium]|nr:S-methyl-5-thioribose-1-phosphate isomerase [candidate division KSB1 bacterium]
MPVETIKWEHGRVKYIDQTMLPNFFVEHLTDDYLVIAEAIRELQVRGAPAIGIAAAFGVVLGAQKTFCKTLGEWTSLIDHIIDELAQTRPTAVNLFWALNRMKNVLHADHPSIDKAQKALFNEAMQIMNEDKRICREMGNNGAVLIQDGATILTHCNAGALATADYGTALGVIYAAKEQGKTIHVYADETRPLLQGARLTAWELMQNEIDVTLICDNMAASVMRQGKIDAIFVGADRIARNGDTANKIGTYNLAILAKYHSIPMYIVAPLSTVDLEIMSGKDIPIEERAAIEVIAGFGKRTAPENVHVYNPAFDVTPHDLITAIITEREVIYPPYDGKLIKLKKIS